MILPLVLALVLLRTIFRSLRRPPHRLDPSASETMSPSGTSTTDVQPVPLPQLWWRSAREGSTRFCASARRKLAIYVALSVVILWAWMWLDTNHPEIANTAEVPIGLFIAVADHAWQLARKALNEGTEAGPNDNRP